VPPPPALPAPLPQPEAPPEPAASEVVSQITTTPPEVEHLACEAQLIEVLASGPEWGETIEAGFRRKEQALATMFAALSRAEAAALHRRLTDVRNDDKLATRFARLVVDRRTRLLAILADVPRREARRR